MGRHRKIDTNRLIAVIDDYHLKHPKAKIKCSDIGEYARSIGISNVTDINIRRNELARKHIADLNSESDESLLRTVISFKPIDTEEFASYSRQKLINALSERDRYYASIAHSAIVYREENNEIKDQNRKLRKENSDLRIKLEKSKADKKQMSLANKKIESLKAVIYKVVYPAEANRLLKQKGVLDFDENIINDDFMEGVMQADTDIGSIKNETLLSIMEDFETNDEEKESSV